MASLACFWFVTGAKSRLGFDDTADGFGIHLLGDMVGSLGTALP
ncbi:hypothetical protein RM533_11825 [Croceicoccus sp. F390]|uniref:Uncharacterized protein n=1 Tax=Croceicoccus esteveae TaxID=3075597 RepID=A0ABU2ZKW4_9SPHN|nr:hypothetical protein [Croceicoccus sp. F390]MDT0576861.1 hypothetical protein [Croceicoccus sp. F390]